MAFMKPVADHFAAYHVETENGTEIVPEDVCGAVDLARWGFDAEVSDHFDDYVQGNVHDVERKEGWYGRLSADGYLDCTEWDGPYPTEREALDAVKEQFDVDDNGDDPNDDDVADGPSSERAP